MYVWSTSESILMVMERFDELRQLDFQLRKRKDRFRFSDKRNPLFVLKGSLRSNEHSCTAKANVRIPLWLDFALIASAAICFALPVFPQRSVNLIVGILLCLVYMLFLRIRITGRFPKKATAPQYKEILLDAMNYAMHCAYTEI